MRRPYSRTSASLFVWMAAVWPAPSLSIFSHISKACSLSSALSTACTGASFSWVSGSSSETSLHSAARIVASAGISKPAALAMNCGDLPGTTELRTGFWPEPAVQPNMYCSSFAFSSALTKYALRRLSSLTSGA